MTLPTRDKRTREGLSRSAPIAEGEQLDVEIERLAYGGDGIARPKGFTVFVPRTAPGESAEILIRDVRRRYARASLQKILRSSGDRVDPFCELYSECGGCHLQHLRYEFAAEQKRLHVVDAFERIGPGPIEVKEIVTPSATRGYRNRLTYHRTDGAEGYVRLDGAGVLDVPSCPLADPELDALWKRVREGLSDVPASTVPFVVLRRTSSGQAAILLSVTTSEDPSEKLGTLAARASLYVTRIEPGARAPFGDEIIRRSGEETLIEEIGGIGYEVEPDIFFQVHPEMTERVVTDVVAWLKVQPVSHLLDLYCGAGLFTLAAAKTGIRSYGVDVAHRAILCGERSARRNSLEPLVHFRSGKAARMLLRIQREGEKFDTAIVDPPRRGIEPDALEMLPKLGVERLLYVSCSPPTLARDAKALLSLGYVAEWCQPYDMFPQTYHVETLTSFQRRT